MSRTATCPMCAWRLTVPFVDAARLPWRRHVDDHAKYFARQVEGLGPDGFRLCRRCVASQGRGHRPCYAVDCACECSC